MGYDINIVNVVINKLYILIGFTNWYRVNLKEESSIFK